MIDCGQCCSAKSWQIYLRNENEIPLENFPFHNQQAAFRVFIRNTFVAVG